MAKCCWCGGCGYKMGALFSTRLYYGCPSFHPDYIRQCDMPQFRVKEVDDVVWNWIQSLLLDPETLDEGLNEYQAHQREKDAPVVERLKLVDNLLTEQNTQLKKLLDLYLSGDFPREMLTERKNHLETTIASLQDERAGLITRLGKNVLSDDQIKSIKEFAAKVAKGIKVADKAINFAARREIIELLDVQVTLTVENGLRVAYARCRLEEKQQRLSIMYNSK